MLHSAWIERRNEPTTRILVIFDNVTLVYSTYVQIRDTDMYDAATDTQNVCVIMYKRIVGPRRTFYHLRGSLELEDRKLVRWAIQGSRYLGSGCLLGTAK